MGGSTKADECCDSGVHNYNATRQWSSCAVKKLNTVVQHVHVDAFVLRPAIRRDAEYYKRRFGVKGVKHGGSHSVCVKGRGGGVHR